MILVNKELINRFAKLGTQENAKDPIIVAHYFHPFSKGHWLAYDYDPTDDVLFGYVSLFNDSACDELGYFSPQELKENNIERDLYWTECPLSEAKKKCGITT